MWFLIFWAVLFLGIVQNEFKARLLEGRDPSDWRALFRKVFPSRTQRSSFSAFSYAFLMGFFFAFWEFFIRGILVQSWVWPVRACGVGLISYVFWMRKKNLKSKALSWSREQIWCLYFSGALVFGSALAIFLSPWVIFRSLSLFQRHSSVPLKS